MFVLSVRIFWGADTRTAGGQIVSLGYGYSLAPAALPPDRVDNTPRVAVPTFWNAGSHKTHCHGIAVEEFIFCLDGDASGRRLPRLRCALRLAGVARNSWRIR
jgi:hypothetical protein